MKTQLLIDYESSKAFLYYFFIFGQFKMEMLEDDRVVDFFGFDRFNISLDDIKKKYLPTVKQRYKISTKICTRNANIAGSTFPKP